MTDERKDQLTAEADGLIEGRNAVTEALRAGTPKPCGQRPVLTKFSSRRVR